MTDRDAPTAPPTPVSAASVPANRRRGGDLRVVLSPRTAGATSGFMGKLTLEPGEAVTEHYHPYSEEFLFVVAGRVTARLDGTQLVELTADDGLLIPVGCRHRVWNPGDRRAELVFHLGPLAPRPELGHVDTESAPGGPSGEPHPEVGGPGR